MLLMGFEHAISAVERPQTYILDRAATGIGRLDITVFRYALSMCSKFVHTKSDWPHKHNNVNI